LSVGQNNYGASPCHTNIFHLKYDMNISNIPQILNNNLTVHD
jgi:hypothetical protein